MYCHCGSMLPFDKEAMVKIESCMADQTVQSLGRFTCIHVKCIVIVAAGCRLTRREWWRRPHSWSSCTKQKAWARTEFSSSCHLPGRASKRLSMIFCHHPVVFLFEFHVAVLSVQVSCSNISCGNILRYSCCRLCINQKLEINSLVFNMNQT